MRNLRAALYLRVSTREQNSAAQEVELLTYATKRGWSATIYRDDGQSGAKENRPGLRAMLGDLRRGQIDVVLVWALDRLARSLRQLLALIEEFERFDVDFVSFKQQLDTSSPAGRLTYSVLGAVAEFEREMLRERVKSGMEQARRAGARIGRPPLKRFTERERTAIRNARAAGASVRNLARTNGTTPYVIERITDGAID